MIGIVELGDADEVTVYVVGGMSAAVHRFKGLGLVQIHAKLRCAGYLVDKEDYESSISRGTIGVVPLKLIQNLRYMIRPV